MRMVANRLGLRVLTTHERRQALNQLSGLAKQKP